MDKHDKHQQYVEIRTDSHGTVIDSRTVCECGEILKDWSHKAARSWWQRAQAGQLVRKDLTGAVLA